MPKKPAPRKSKNDEARKHAFLRSSTATTMAILQHSNYYIDQKSKKKYCDMMYKATSLSTAKKGNGVTQKEIEITHLFYKASPSIGEAEANEEIYMKRIPGKLGHEIIITDTIATKSRLKRELEVTLAGLYGLKQIHANNILHRDIKEDNYLVFPFYNPFTCEFQYGVQYIDFGLSAYLEGDEERLKTPQGTPSRTAPETLNINIPNTPASDLYSFCICLLNLYQINYTPVTVIKPSIPTFKTKLNYQFPTPQVLKSRCSNASALQLLNATNQNNIINLLSDGLYENPSERPAIEAFITTLEQIYQTEFKQAYQHFHQPDYRYQPSNNEYILQKNKLDKLIDISTRLLGFIHNPSFKSPHDAILLPMFIQKLESYASDAKLASIFPDENDALSKLKRKIFKALATYAAHRKDNYALFLPPRMETEARLMPITQILYQLNTCTCVEDLKTNITLILDGLETGLLKRSTLRDEIQPLVKESLSMQPNQ